MSERVFFINNEWLTYKQAHLLGYTLVKPKILTLYKDDLTTVQIKQDVTDNTFYDSDNHRWVTDINALNLYLKLDSTTNLYYGESYKVYDSFTDSAFSTEPKYVRVDNSIVSVESMYNNKGATLYPCVDYSVDKTSVLSWYDDRTSLYWDDQLGRKFWSDSPPVINVDHKDSVITPSTSKMEMLPQWEYDLSQAPINYRVSSFTAQDETLNSQESLKSGFQFIDYSLFDEVQNLVDFKFYPDLTELNVTFYVFPEEGTHDYDGTFHPQGDTFTGDQQIVWVDSDS